MAKEQPMVFVAEDPGDPSVGINGAQEKISFDGNTRWTIESIDEMKQLLADFYGCGKKYILTEEEYNEMICCERNAERQMIEQAKRICEEGENVSL